MRAVFCFTFQSTSPYRSYYVGCFH